MKKYILILFLGAMLFGANPMEAKSYYLYSSIGGKEQNTHNGSRMLKRPLSIDVSNQVITVPNQVLGYTLTIEGEEGEVYASVLLGNTIILSENLEGEFEFQITNGTTTYTGKLYM